MEADTPDTPAFPLLQLPPELLVHFIEIISSSRPSGGTFPAGAPKELIALCGTCRLFAKLCRPYVWQAINFVPLRLNIAPEQRERRDLPRLNELVDSALALGGDWTIPPIIYFSIAHDHIAMAGESTATNTTHPFLCLVQTLARHGTLKALWVEKTSMTLEAYVSLIRIISLPESISISALRFNQNWIVDQPEMRHHPDPTDDTRLPGIKTLQIMHAADEMRHLLKRCDNLESYLFWPERRRASKSMMASLSNNLHKIRFLSLDVVYDPSCINLLTARINELEEAGTTLPLEELFLEGYLNRKDIYALVQSLSNTNVKRLALYQIREEATPSLFDLIARTLPDLEGLTIVSGDTQQPIDWSHPWEDHQKQLVRMKKLKFFAFDRETRRDRRSNALQDAVEVLNMVGNGCPSLTEAVAIRVDVAEGCKGYFAKFGPGEKEGERKITGFKKSTAKDFLIPFERWTVLE